MRFTVLFTAVYAKAKDSDRCANGELKYDYDYRYDVTTCENENTVSAVSVAEAWRFNAADTA